MNCWARNVCRVVLVFAIVSAGVRNVRAQSTTPEQTAADSYYNAKDWQKAAPAYEALAKANPANWAGLVSLGRRTGRNRTVSKSHRVLRQSRQPRFPSILRSLANSESLCAHG